MLTLAKLALVAPAVGMLAMLPDAAHAATIQLTTSSLYADSGQSYHACNFTNVSNAAVTAKIYLINSTSGGHTIVSTVVPITIAARTNFELGTATGYTGFAWCKFVTTAPASSVRANITVFRWTGTYYISLGTLEAH